MAVLKHLSSDFFKNENLRENTVTGRLKYLTNDFIFNMNMRTEVGEKRMKLVPHKFADRGNFSE